MKMVLHKAIRCTKRGVPCPAQHLTGVEGAGPSQTPQSITNICTYTMPREKGRLHPPEHTSRSTARLPADPACPRSSPRRYARSFIGPGIPAFSPPRRSTSAFTPIRRPRALGKRAPRAVHHLFSRLQSAAAHAELTPAEEVRARHEALSTPDNSPPATQTTATYHSPRALCAPHSRCANGLSIPTHTPSPPSDHLPDPTREPGIDFHSALLDRWCTRGGGDQPTCPRLGAHLAESSSPPSRHWLHTASHPTHLPRSSMAAGRPCTSTSRSTTSHPEYTPLGGGPTATHPHTYRFEQQNTLPGTRPALAVHNDET
jgi:hypothetical protein